MFAVVEIAGQQFKVERGNKVYVHRLEANEGDKIEFENVFLLDNAARYRESNPLSLADGRITIGRARAVPDIQPSRPRHTLVPTASPNHRGLTVQLLVLVLRWSAQHRHFILQIPDAIPSEIVPFRHAHPR